MSFQSVRSAAAEVRDLSEYPVNGWLHFGGAIAAAVALFVTLVQFGDDGSARRILALSVFGGTAVLMFSASALYHLSKSSRLCGLYRRLDHSAIYVFIAGTYTPICLLAMQGTTMGRVLLSAVWAIAAVGVLFKVLWIDAPRGLSTMMYLAMGWVGALSVPMMRGVTPAGFLVWLIAGGLLYTIGAIIYWKKWPLGVPGKFGFHELWHVCVIGAVACHYVAVVGYIAPLG